MLSLEHNKGFWYLCDGENPVLTPRGNLLGASDKRLMETVQSDYLAYGADPAEHWSIYALQCSYLDFAFDTDREHLLMACQEDLEWDPIYQDLAFYASCRTRTARGDLLPAARYPVDYLTNTGFFSAWSERREGNSTIIDLGAIDQWYEDRTRDLNIRGILCLVYAGAHWRAPITFLAMLDGQFPPGKTIRLAYQNDRLATSNAFDPDGKRVRAKFLHQMRRFSQLQEEKTKIKEFR